MESQKLTMAQRLELWRASKEQHQPFNVHYLLTS